MRKPEDRPDVIVITRDEASSTHVDELLVRQSNLRGEKIAASKKRAWYTQNWVVLMLAGCLGAFSAWALLEPYYNDCVYFQGEIQEAAVDEELGTGDAGGPAPARGWVKIRGQKIWLLSELTQIEPDGKSGKCDRTTLKVGQTVGIYLHPVGEMALGRFVAVSPPPQKGADATLTVSGLASRSGAAGLLVFPLVAAFVGLMIGAADGLVCRLFRRALLGGLVGFFCGFIGGFVSSFVANLVYAPLNHLAMANVGSGGLANLSTMGFLIQTGGRALAWGLAGIAMGLGQGIALRSKRLLLYGLLGGIVGGVLGGMVFDPIDLLMLGGEKPSAHVSRLAGFLIIGACVGAMIGLVELMARDAWLRMVQGPLAGKEFLLFKDQMVIGASPRSDIYLFNDAQVGDAHAILRGAGDQCEIEALTGDRPLLVNGGTVRTARLRHGDQITIGRTVFVYEQRQG